MSTDFYPEVHDIGKLGDVEHLNADIAIPLKFSDTHPFKDDKGKPYTFDTIGIKEPQNLTWLGVRYHHLGGSFNITFPGNRPDPFKEHSYEDCAKIFLLCIADHLASAVSRAIAEDVKKQLPKSSPEPLLKLWNPSYRKSLDLPIHDLETLKKALDLIQNRPSEFLNEYRDALLSTPEDKMPLLNLTTLSTHCKLVGRIYGFLRGNTELVTKNGRTFLRYAEKDISTIMEAEKNWRFILLVCKVFFPQRPARAKDLNIFHLQHSLIAELKGDTNLLLNTSDTMWFLFPEGKEVKKELQAKLDSFLDYGFFFEFFSEDYALTSGHSELMGSGIKEKDPLKWQAVYLQKLEEQGTNTLPPPLCSVCQMKMGEPRYDYDEEGVSISEDVCKECYKIRGQGKLGKMEEWERESPGARVAWVRILLDPIYMEEKIRHLFEKEVESKGISDDLKGKVLENVRLVSLMADFVEDYLKLTKEFAEEITNHLSEDLTMFLSEEYKDFFVVKLPEGTFIQKMIDIFLEKMKSKESGFPACLENSPIQLRISTSRVKYPFFEHLEYLKLNREEKNPPTIRITSLPNVKVDLNPSQFNTLKTLDLLKEERRRSFLHKLASIESRTNSLLLVRAELLDERETKEISMLKKKLKELDKYFMKKIIPFITRLCGTVF